MEAVERRVLGHPGPSRECGERQRLDPPPSVLSEHRFRGPANLTRLLALDRAPAGKYTQLRLVVNSVEGILSDGTPVTLIVPSGELKTTTPFDVPGSGAVRVTLDFDLASSIHAAGGQWIFRPVLGSIQIS